MLKSLYLASQSPRRLELLRQIGLAPAVLLLRNA
jgi:predicted house-cleaning NTP pyrophosphatase (Maf/HAM1 superfamily)